MIILRPDPARARGAVLLAAIAFSGVISSALLPLMAMVVHLLVLAIFAAWPLARGLAIPLGMPRAARFLTKLATLRYGVFADDMGRVAAAWALLRRPTDGNRDRVEDMLISAEAHKPLDATQLLARGLMSAARGDATSARRTISAVETFSASSTHEDVFRIASDYLIAEAASRGDWRIVAKLGREPRRSRPGRFMGLAAARILELEPVSDGALRWAWLTSGAPMSLEPILDRALTRLVGTVDASAAEPVELPVEASPLSTAMMLELALVRRAPGLVLAADVARLGRAWDRALGEVRTETSRRARDLGVYDVEPIVAGLEEDARRGLVALAERSKLDLGALSAQDPPSRTLEEAARVQRNSTLEALETQVRALRRRLDQKRSLPAIDEWREWDSIHATAEAAFEVGGLSLRRVAFPSIHVDLCAYAVWLANERKERRLAHVIFSWLLIQARALDDAEAIRLQERNASATMG
ncbi:MAG: hypothetical protein HY791_00620 [Deltaproteobacteria bacterium]|nr:hypothetical protein [Deltaproteobacteria bacterium]